MIIFKKIIRRVSLPLFIILISSIIYTTVELNTNIYKTLQLTIAIFCVLLFIRLFDMFYLSDEIVKKREYTLPELFKNLIIASIWLIAGTVWMLLHIENIGTYTGFFATSSVMIAIVGFAVRNLVSDFFSGITLGLESPFRIGDWIEPEPGMVGKVLEMNWRSTKIATKENIYIVIPNSQLSSITFRNYNLPDPLFRVSFDVTLDYDITANQVQRILLSAANKIPEIRNCPKKPDIKIKEFSPRGVVWEMRFWLDDYYNKDTFMFGVQKNILRNFHYANLTISPEKFSMIKTPQYNKEKDLVHLLSKVNIFENLEHDEIEFLAQHTIKHIYPAGKYVIHEGDDGDSMFMVADGLLTISVKKDDNSLLEVATLQSGDFFGEVALVTGEKRTSTVQAFIDSTLYEIPKSAMEELLKNHKYLVRTLSKAVAKRQVSNYRKMITVEKEEEKQLELDKATKSNIRKILKFFNFQ